jgi:translation initiation factor 1A
LGKKKVISEDSLSNLVLPATTDVFGVATKLLGNDRIFVKCQDGHDRVCRIRGKLKRRAWIRLNDIVLVSPWDFQFETRGDIIWRYTRGQVDLLKRRGILQM